MGHRDIPVLETKRLILKGPEPQDYPDFKATFTSFRARYMGGPLNPYEAWMLYAAEIGHWEIRGFGMWMIHDKDTNVTLGMAGGWQPAMWPERELAWIIWPEVAGKGYALEAVDAARRHFYKSGWEGAVSYLDPYNLDSVRLAERLGCKKDKDAKSIGDEDSVYRHPSPEALRDTQLAHGIAMEISHYHDPAFKPKGFALD
ncbi:GNAT family N-acetyltransferase [Litoreibacter janthinus]|uniref:Protein N-acetyltransferase, RimJ/RimL family n=1 Tax=Litoreibacter janthinus TaxID=670154 RepID=A0A1I6HXA8_9RHOB|nr:GNAT family N-acetyltransferase [Litoreibacter janthinus]SFR59038.1 Protein N-acetyltransferase, RimJ/RimL family [Litoreibacter janthinus]